MIVYIILGFISGIIFTILMGFILLNREIKRTEELEKFINDIDNDENNIHMKR